MPLSRADDPQNRRSVLLQLPASVHSSLKTVVIAIVVLALYYGQEILIPFALAALLAFVLDPMVNYLKRWRIPRAPAVILVTIAAMSVLGGLSLLVGLQVVQLSKNIPEYQATIEKKIRSARQEMPKGGAFSALSRLIDSVEKEVEATRVSMESKNGLKEESKVVRVQMVEPPLNPVQAIGTWLGPLMGPLLTGGVAFILLIFILLEKNDLRDRLLRMVGGDLHRMTDALDEAGTRVSRYLAMQLMVNTGYGLFLAGGLWLVGVPGALLWGMLAAAMRFIPYVGPIIAAVCPTALAFAVDPGWSMVFWTIGLIGALELILNNIVEPLAYGSSTGMATIALLMSASFWTVVWGPVGLILATPLTVCLVVMGRYLPQLAFLDLLLGSDPVFDPPTRLYQRLLAGNVEEAAEMAEQQISQEGLATFYSQTAVPALGKASDDYSNVSSAEHRLRVVTGMQSLIRELKIDHPIDAVPRAKILCIGLKWEADTLASEMLSHVLVQEGLPATALAANTVSAERIGQLDLTGVRLICLSSFHPDPAASARYVSRRLRRLNPNIEIVLALWNAPAELHEPGAAEGLGANSLATTLLEASQRIKAMQPEMVDPSVVTPSSAPESSVATAQEMTQQRQFLTATEPARALVSPAMAHRAAEVFNVTRALIWWADESTFHWQGTNANIDAAAFEPIREAFLRPLLLPESPTLVVPDLARDHRWQLDASQSDAYRFLAATTLKSAEKDGLPVGVICLLDRQPRSFDDSDVKLLEALALDLVKDTLAPPTDAALPEAVLHVDDQQPMLKPASL